MTEGKPERALAGINFPPIKTREEAANAQQAASAPGDVRKDMEDDIPPVIRSVLEMSHLMTSGHSHYFRATPGYQGGLYYDGKPFCFASGYRDSKRPRDMEDKGNHMKLKDPIVYGCLSLPVTAAYLIELHRNQTFDLHKPLVAYLPSLESKVGPDVTARSILSFTTVLDDKAILRDAKANWRAPLLSLNPCASMQKCVYEPINRFLAGKDTKSLNGKTQRENLALYVGSSKRPSAILRRTPRKASLSHFSVALLIAAVETQLKGQTFEASIRENFFTKAQCHGTGYGPPKLYRDPNEMFYQPTGLALQHQNFRTPVHGGTLDNCGPPVFNASLNMYAPAEDFGKLFLLSLDAIMDAREVLPETEKDDYHFCDFGIEFAPQKDMCYSSPRVLTGIDFVPSAASFRYNIEHDLGCFGVSSCGSRGGRLFANTLSKTIQYLFVKHVIGSGEDATKPVDLNDPANSASTETTEKFDKVVKKREFKNYFNKHDSHKRF